MKLHILCLARDGWHFSYPDCPWWSWAIRELGADLAYYGEANVSDLAKGCDVLVVFSTMDGSKLPAAQDLIAARATCKRMVLVCTDGCHHSHSILCEYIGADVFDTMVNLDGNDDWPHRQGKDWTVFGVFDPVPWQGRNVKRTRKLGFNGRLDPRRMEILPQLGARVETYYPPEHLMANGQRLFEYQQYIDWVLACHAVINPGGRANPRVHLDQVKGRINETALAGCLLFEEEGSTTNRWLKPVRAGNCTSGIPDADYLEFIDSEEVVAVLERPDFEQFAAIMGTRLRNRILSDYGPKRLWEQITGDKL